ncbi:hypothetical protein [Rummeliibacillus pycnus]|uniref:hypothetical protein n=1 Tax=Rummeliibacillus pycnus TaxID=101070 RepID=UPI0037C8D351
MRKKEWGEELKLKLFICILFFSLLVGCTAENQEPLWEITRVDVQKDASNKEVVVITETETMELLKSYFEKISWENAKSDMARKHDVNIILTIDFDKKKISKEYNIWFNKDNSATVIDYNDHKTGRLNKKDAKGFKEILIGS